MAGEPLAWNAAAERLGEMTEELVVAARDARARSKAERERARRVVAASRQAWEARRCGGLPERIRGAEPERGSRRP